MMAAMKADHAHLATYLANRRAQMIAYHNSWEKLYPGVAIEPPMHVPGTLNIADLALFLLHLDKWS